MSKIEKAHFCFLSHFLFHHVGIVSVRYLPSSSFYRGRFYFAFWSSFQHFSSCFSFLESSRRSPSIYLQSSCTLKAKYFWEKVKNTEIFKTGVDTMDEFSKKPNLTFFKLPFSRNALPRSNLNDLKPDDRIESRTNRRIKVSKLRCSPCETSLPRCRIRIGVEVFYF